MQNMISISLMQETPRAAVFHSGMPMMVPGRAHLPQRLAAAKADAAALTGTCPENVVAVIPSAWHATRRSELLREAQKAGMKIQRFVTAPAAAALMDYRRKQALYESETDQNVLICTQVGTFFDAAIASVSQGVIEIIASEFTEHLSQESVDRVLFRLLEAADRPAGPFNRILMVGGAYHFPGVQDWLRKYINTNTMTGVYNEEDLALGGAVMCGILEGRYSGPLLINVLSHAMSIRTENDTLTTLLARNTAFPCEEKKVFTNVQADQPVLRLWLYEGDGKTITSDKLVSCIRITDAPCCGAGKAQIEIKLFVDANGFFRVDARELTTGKTLNLERSAEETGSLLRPLSDAPEQPVPAAPPRTEDPDAVQALVLKFLPVYDDLLLALEQPTTDAAFKKGIHQTMKKLTGIFRELGVEMYGDRGETFDPRIHNAVMHMKSDRYADNTVVKVLQKGVKLNGKIIRFAMVQVAN